MTYNRATSKQSENDPNSDSPINLKPFLAVCSFTNPHDIAAYPTLPRQFVEKDKEHNPDSRANRYGPGGSVPVPKQGTLSASPQNGSFRIPLNPTGLPQDNATPSPTQDGDFNGNNKPDCQYDYSIKLGLGLASKTGLAVAKGLSQKSSDEWTEEVLLQAACDVV